ncbi:hypothetical protein ACI65C_000279 [Semiaphis heraclei]
MFAMFLSKAVVSVFVFTILLNFIYVYSAEETTTAGAPPTTPEAKSKNFTTCEQCLNSKCLDSEGVCVPNEDPQSTFQCLECKTDADNNRQFFTEELCKKGCPDVQVTKSCICKGPCYSCVVTADYPNPNPSDCNYLPIRMANKACELVETWSTNHPAQPHPPRSNNMILFEYYIFFTTMIFVLIKITPPPTPPSIT